MIVTRTPLRISFFGGGTDFPEYFRRNRGSVIGVTIDRHVYVTAMRLSPVHPYRYRLYWSKIERANEIAEIEHPVVRKVLELRKTTEPLGFSIIADLPARNGLGSSSAFTVGFIQAMRCLDGMKFLPDMLADGAITVERKYLEEAGGWQDQYHCAYGGINRFDFSREGVVPIRLDVKPSIRDLLADSLMLVSCGDARNSWEVNGQQIARTKAGENDRYLEAMLQMVDVAEEILMGRPDGFLNQFGSLLDDNWRLKRELSNAISSSYIDGLYQKAKDAGATGGKLCGAGGGGFLAMIVPKERQAAFRERLAHVPVIKVGLDYDGSTVLMDKAARYD